MGNIEPTVNDVLQAARQMLEFAKLGAKDFNEAGERRLPGLFNAVANGRSVTFVLQKLRGRAAGFDEWYSEVQGELKADAVARWFVEVRNRIEKEGTQGPATISMRGLDIDSDELVAKAPANATGMFIGDQMGRSGWFVELQDGSEEKIYFTFPPSSGWVGMMIHDAPGGRSVEDLLPSWLSKIEGIVVEAEAKFGGAPR